MSLDIVICPLGKLLLLKTTDKLFHDLLSFGFAVSLILHLTRNWQWLQNILILIIVIIVLPDSDGLESYLSSIACLLFCLVFLLLSVIPLSQIQLHKVVFVRTFYTGIDSAGIQISEIITITASEKKAIYFLIIVEGGNA